MGIYNVNFYNEFQQLLPPKKRKKFNMAWMGVFAKSFQRLRDLWFSDYADGFTGLKYNVGTNYAKGDRQRYIDHSVYEALDAIPAGNPPPDARWLKILDVWIGVRERINYNSQKIVFETALNKWFDTTFRLAPGLSDIYITTNLYSTNGFIIGVDENESSTIKIPIEQEYYILDAFVFGTINFTINVPDSGASPIPGWYTALGPDAATRENIIRSYADKYVMAGIIYQVSTY